MMDHPGSARTNACGLPGWTAAEKPPAGPPAVAHSCLNPGPSADDAATDQLERMTVLGLLAAEIAHEVNNLMTVVLGSLALLRRETPSGTGQELLRRAEWGAQQAGRLTRQELSLVRCEMRQQAVDVNEIVGGFDTIMALVAGEHVEMEVVLTREPVAACLDPGHLRLALLNLVRNASDALTGSRGRIRVETRRHTTLEPFPDAAVEVLVADTGPGMPAALVQHAAIPFVSTKAPGRGTGLGLWLVHRFVDTCGGRVAIDTAAGRGTTVRLLFPQSG